MLKAFRHLRVHDLRHLTASLLLAQGAPLKVVSDIRDITRIAVTPDTYAHVLPNQNRMPRISRSVS
jgi:integrase